MNPHNIPPDSGTYVLIISVEAAITLHAGRLGDHLLAPGFYAYVGSAHGPGGLRARVGRHLRHNKTVHWHIDALTSQAAICGVWLRASEERLECTWAGALAAVSGVTRPVTGFGASDCKCPAHLFALPQNSLRAAWEALDQPDTCPVDFWPVEIESAVIVLASRGIRAAAPKLTESGHESPAGPHKPA